MKRNSTMSLFAAMLLLTGSGCILMTGCQKDYDGQIEILRNQIENGDVNVDNLLEKIELIEKQIVTLQESSQGTCRIQGEHQQAYQRPGDYEK